MKKQYTVLVVGGYGVVGSYISELLAARNSNVKVIVAGRNMEKAQRAASKISGAEAVIVDVDSEDPLEYLYKMPDAIIVSVNDTHDHLLRKAIQESIPLLDIARWHRRVEDAKQVYRDERRNSPVILASGWVASVPSIVAKAYQGNTIPFNHVEIDILLALNDKTGPDSVTSFVDADRPFWVWEDGEKREVKGFTDPKTVLFSNNAKFTSRRMSCPEHMTLVDSGITRGASVRMAFKSQFMNRVFAFLIRSGIWRCLPLNTRKSLLHNPKNTVGQPHEFVVTLKSKSQVKVIHVIDDEGQAHLTAASTVGQFERLLGLNGRVRVSQGVHFPEQAEDPNADLDVLTSLGVRFVERHEM